jgi:predicted kinase
MEIDFFDASRRARIEGVQWDLAQRLLALGVTVIIEWGTWARSERDSLRQRARELGAAVELCYLSAPLQVLARRVTRRGMESPPLTAQDMKRYEEQFEAPTPEETALYDRPISAE